MPVPVIVQEYIAVKDQITLLFNTYNSMLYPALSTAGKWTDCLVHATIMGDSTVSSLPLMYFIHGD
jgi:hypothetical protein